MITKEDVYKLAGMLVVYKITKFFRGKKEIKMGEKLGIKETKEALAGLNELSIFMVKHLKDGIGLDDAEAVFAALVGSSEFKSKLEAAAAGIANVPSEMKDMDMLEAVELIKTQIDYLPKLKAALAG